MTVLRSIPLGRTGSRRILRAMSMAASFVLTLSLSASTLAATSPMRWHRLNVHSDPAEHERFSCLASGDAWRCR